MSFDQSAFVHQAIKLVVPMRREFGHSIRVENMLSDPAYAQTVLELALSSNNERLRELALYMQRMLSGPRGGPSVPVDTPLQSGPITTETEESSSVDAERAALEAQKADKYRRGLR